MPQVNHTVDKWECWYLSPMFPLAPEHVCLYDAILQLMIKVKFAAENINELVTNQT